MAKEPKLPHRLRWGGRTAARVGEADYPTGIGLVGHTGLEGATIAEVHEGVADGAGARGMPEGLRGAGSGGVSMRKPRAGAYCKYIKLKDIVHEEN